MVTEQYTKPFTPTSAK